MMDAVRSTLERVASALADPREDAPPTERPGALAMPEQTAESDELAAANTRFSVEFAPGFLEGPTWPVEVWLLSSFQMSLSGSLVVGVALDVTPENERLPVTLSLVQNGHPVWSQELDLKLVPELGTDKQHFNFQVGVFVDLTNSLRYDAGSQPHFEISGLVPVYKPAGPSVEERQLTTLESLLSEAEGTTVDMGELIRLVAEDSASQEAVLREVVAELEASGVSRDEMLDVLRDEMLEVLRQIATNTEGE